jgi:hypothetical protein
MPAHVFDERELKDITKLKLPENYRLRVFLCTSGDSNKEYWVQLLMLRSDIQAGRWEKAIVLCDCPVGKFQGAPLTIVNAGEPCKHGEALIQTLRSRASKKK